MESAEQSLELINSYMWHGVGEYFRRDAWLSRGAEEILGAMASVPSLTDYVDVAKLPESLKNGWENAQPNTVFEYVVDLPNGDKMRKIAFCQKLVEPLEFPILMQLVGASPILTGVDFGHAVTSIVGKLQALAARYEIIGFTNTPLMVAQHGVSPNLVVLASVFSFPVIVLPDGKPETLLELFETFTFLEPAESSREIQIEFLKNVIKNQKETSNG